MLDPPRARPDGVEFVKGPNLASQPDFAPFPAGIPGRVLHKVGDDISTDGISHAGSRVLSLRSNIPEISRFAFETVDPNHQDRVLEVRDAGVLVDMAGDVDTGRARAASPPPSAPTSSSCAHRARSASLGVPVSLGELRGPWTVP
ncbi:MAG: hypothetical protein ACRENY_07255 [Candidatus Dormibacteria bacterium]